MDYLRISKATIGTLYKSFNSLNYSPLSPEIRKLVELRTSQINGCAYCCQLHTEEARKANVPQQKLDVLPAWEDAAILSSQERAVLKWCELVTRSEASSNEAKKLLEEHLSEREIVDLTACIAIMNALNRIAMTLRKY